MNDNYPRDAVRILITTVLCCAALLALAVAAPIGQFKAKVTLAWNYPTNEYRTNYSFSVYHSTNAAIPVTNWTQITNITFPTITNLLRVGTNFEFQATLPTIAGEHFFFLTVSNDWGESRGSNVAGTPPVPRDDIGLRATPTE